MLWELPKAKFSLFRFNRLGQEDHSSFSGAEGPVLFLQLASQLPFPQVSQPFLQNQVVVVLDPGERNTDPSQGMHVDHSS